MQVPETHYARAGDLRIAAFTDVGEHDLKGIDGSWRLFSVAAS